MPIRHRQYSYPMSGTVTCFHCGTEWQNMQALRAHLRFCKKRRISSKKKRQFTPSGDQNHSELTQTHNEFETYPASVYEPSETTHFSDDYEWSPESYQRGRAAIAREKLLLADSERRLAELEKELSELQRS